MARVALVPGRPTPLGATVTPDGVNFAVHSSVAEAVTLCLFDADGRETRRLELPACDDATWHGFLPGAGPGLRYGYRVRGPYRPSLGLRCNPHKLLVDPYARALEGRFAWHPSVFDYRAGGKPAAKRMCELDDLDYVPKGVVTEELPSPAAGPRVPWKETVIYELNVRGYTMRHPGLSESERGRFRGLANGQIVDYLRALGITSVELMPVHEFIDEQFLVDRGLRNFWGYNTLNFFTPATRYANGDGRAEFVEMVDALHDANIEVLLDVVYNHTAEGDHRGPTLSYRGFDNAAYYRLASDRFHYVNDTGCGNTLDADSPVVQDLVLDSLRYWAGAMGVDGFRFDLAPILGRHAHGFDPDHPLLEGISSDPALSGKKLVAEPWDPGPGGYQLGAFGPRWAELNDRFRDTVRRWWRGDHEASGAFAERLHGSADLFERAGRDPASSVNYVANHDGFTLADTVSYLRRHNEANGEDNRDGHGHNCSENYGVEGPTDDPEIAAIRRRQRLNLVATTLLAQGTPLILAGDELGQTQHGNNNGYAQDNETTWIDWSLLYSPASILEEVRQLIGLRRSEPLLHLDSWLHAGEELVPGWPDILWLSQDGTQMHDEAWLHADALALVIGADLSPPRALALLMNAGSKDRHFHFPDPQRSADWTPLFRSAGSLPWQLPPRSLQVFAAVLPGQPGPG